MQFLRTSTVLFLASALGTAQPEARAALEVEPIRPARRFAEELDGPHSQGLIRDRSGPARKR